MRWYDIEIDNELLFMTYDAAKPPKIPYYKVNAKIKKNCMEMVATLLRAVFKFLNMFAE